MKRRVALAPWAVAAPPRAAALLTLIRLSLIRLSLIRLSLIGLSVLVFAMPLSADAAGGPVGQTGRYASPQGWALHVPPGLGAVWQPKPTPIKEDRSQLTASGTLLLVHDGTEILRLDLYPDATARTPLQWVRSELPLAIHGARLHDAVATAAAVPCTVADLERSPQRHQQRLAFFRLGRQMAQLTCQIGAGPAAAGWCEAVRLGLEPPATPAAKRGGQR